VADIGSNSIHLLVAVTDGVHLSPLTDESIPSDLGRLVERHEEIGGKASAEVAAALQRFHDRALQLGAPSLSVVATEPLRRATDRTKVLSALRKEIGIEPNQILHVGTRINDDLAVAKSYGFRTVLYAGDRTSLQATGADLKNPETKPDRLITELLQLRNILQA